MACPPPDPALGTALRITGYLDCNASLIGRDGFVRLAELGMSEGLVAGLITISVAMVGYRFLLGDTLSLRDGTSWILRIGVVLALLGSWPAFQTLFYDVTISGPAEIAGELVSITGQSEAGVAQRIQRAYDTLRLGIAVPESSFENTSTAALASAGAYQFQPPMPKTATMFLLVTTGLTGSIKMVAGFLLAIAPLPILALMFAPTWGLFVGWFRALATTIFASMGSIFLNSLHLFAVEAEIARFQNSIGIASAAQVDPQAIVAIVSVFGLIALGMVMAVVRLSGAIAAIALPYATLRAKLDTDGQSMRPNIAQPGNTLQMQPHQTTGELDARNERIVTVTDALERILRRENSSSNVIDSSERPLGTTHERRTEGNRHYVAHEQRNAQRALGRRHRSSIRRDNVA